MHCEKHERKMSQFRRRKEGENPQSRHTSSASRFPLIRSDFIKSTDFVPQTPTSSPSIRKDPARRNTTSCLSDPVKCREEVPFLGRQRPKIFEKYKPLKLIGKGQGGTVFAVEERSPAHLPALSGDRKDKPRVYACKMVDLATLSVDAINVKSRNARREEVVNEIKIMMVSSSGSHPNVQDLIDYVIEDDQAYIISSLYRGGDLAQVLEKHGCLREEHARKVMSGILNGLAHLHSRGVVHRDIKLENILLGSKHDMSQVKIIDMGFAKYQAAPCAEAMNTVRGTPLYIAPEVVRPTLQTGTVKNKARYGTQVDMWSCGVVMYYLLSGYPPFGEAGGCTNMLDLFEDIEKAAYDLSDPVWDEVSTHALTMLKGLLEADPAKRLTAEEAMRHSWMVGC